MNYSRRDFGKLAIAGIPLASAAISGRSVFAAEKPNSVFSGIQVGVIIPYSYHNMANDSRSLLDDMVRDGISACESHAEQIEEFCGGPAQARPGAARGGAGGAAGAGAGAGRGTGAPPAPPTPEQLAAQKAKAEATTKWRVSAPMEKFADFRKMYNDAGVSIYGFKLTLTDTMPDEEFDYTFNAAKALGASQVTMEMPESGELTKRVGQFATKHKMMVGYHAHLQATPATWDEAMSQSAYNGINLDIGHYTAAGNHDAIAFMQKNHARITSLHLKDRKFPENGGQNVPWGQGDTPIKEALQLIKKEKYKFPVTIELEYPPPPGSDSEQEIVKCLAFAKACLA